ncbi:hypothetical protein BKA62DRAFT_721802 [Auriculariales sp. MPI-PUGE-AT-0066]|nr:hypothetical protein BKA62DRAFT_721802 [Auriculariales sp. MPI-PUGE-AT-0066]
MAEHHDHDHSHPHPHPHPHPPPQQPGQGQPQMVQLTQEQIAQLTPQQRAQLMQMQQMRMQQQQQQQQQQQAPAPRADPVMQAIIDADFKPVSLQLGGEPTNTVVVCKPHAKETCAECKTDFAALNQLTKSLINRPELAFPPPPQVQPPPHRSAAITKTKEDGNNNFKAQKWVPAIQLYTMAANIAASRDLWENSQLMRDELALVLCNRSAAHLSNGEPEQALVDANLVVQLKAPWGKGHFRRAKALAKATATGAKQLEPASAETDALLVEIERALQKETEGTAPAGEFPMPIAPTEEPTSPISA